MKKLLFILVLIVAFAAYERFQIPDVQTINAPTAETQTASRDGQWRSGDQVHGSGRVIRILSDDNDGSRHQRFIVELSSGRTLLVAHNIDLAPRISALRKGDTVVFHGEYEPNSQGGVIHWTHHDPRGRHVAGWLEHEGRRYQ